MLERRLCEQISLKQVYPLARQPPILLLGLHSFSNDVDSKFKTDAVDCPNNGLARAVALYASNQLHIQLYLVGLEVGQQVEPGIARAKSSMATFRPRPR